MKKYFKTILLILTCNIYGCNASQSDATQEVSFSAALESNSTTENSSDKYDKSIDSQIQIIVKNRDVWKILYEDGPSDSGTSPYSFFYITDFDHNGRLEITASETQGSGIITFANVYEINSDYNGIELIDENDNVPEFYFEAIKTFYNKADQTYIYIGTNYEKSGALWGKNSKCAISLDHGVLHCDIIAEEAYQPKGEDSDDLVYSFYDNYGATITEEQFKNAEDNLYKSYERQDISLGVIYNQSENEFEKLPDDIMAQILKKSYETFTGQIGYDEFNEVENIIRTS
ncbi:MAG: hypothetical protein J6H31_15640 [Butyrivibrio sp.]|nr:hypothetical protein [Butyrivibrio sp.]MBP3819720.1 hypothetical protein [Butyrivibrio sp.]